MKDNSLDEIDEFFSWNGLGVAECVLCKHDIYNHYWNGAGSAENSGWDSCKVDKCKCIGKDNVKEPNTVYECPLETRFVPSKQARTTLQELITKREREAYKKGYIDRGIKELNTSEGE